jgi:hypothetical protein
VAEAGDWLRVRGMGRERFAGYFADYLTSLGYEVERTDSTEPAETRLTATLRKMNPAIPQSAGALRFRLTPTSGGAAVVWEAPEKVPEAERPRLDRMVREFQAHLERAVLTESHATAKVTAAPVPRFPWSAPRPAAGPSGAPAQPL